MILTDKFEDYCDAAYLMHACLLRCCKMWTQGVTSCVTEGHISVHIAGHLTRVPHIVRDHAFINLLYV